MAQNEIMEFLDKNKGKKFSTADLSKKLDLGNGTVSRSMLKLREKVW